MRAEIVGNRVIVTDPLNREYYRSDVIGALESYAVTGITALRSAQTGFLVVTLGGFYVGTSTGQALTLATDYKISQPVAYEDYRG